MGGLAIALPHGSILFEVAKFESHATTSIPHPDNTNPCRISIVFYQHRNMYALAHGRDMLRIRNGDKDSAETAGRPFRSTAMYRKNRAQKGGLLKKKRKLLGDSETGQT